MVYTLAIIVGLGMAFILQFVFNIPFMTTFISFVLVFALYAGYNLYMTYKSKNLASLARFLEKSANTLNYFFFTQKEGSVEEQQKALQDVLLSYPSKIVQGQYKAYSAMLDKNYQQALTHAESIPNAAMRNESVALVEATIGKKSAAEQMILGRPAFKHFILAITAYRAKDMKAFENHKQQCLDKSSGAQYFSNYYFLERIAQYVKK